MREQLDDIIKETIIDIRQLMVKIEEADACYRITSRKDYAERAHFLRGQEETSRFILNQLKRIV
tara:strand:- start:605 stop:796 length:192 start_codon:yes stop_codon:yes gene_type:complete